MKIAAVLVTPPTIPAGMTRFRWNATRIHWNRYKSPYLGAPLLNNEDLTHAFSTGSISNILVY